MIIDIFIITDIFILGVRNLINYSPTCWYQHGVVGSGEVQTGCKKEFALLVVDAFVVFEIRENKRKENGFCNTNCTLEYLRYYLITLLKIVQKSSNI